ncbi:MAG: Hpt domain-containing protein [Gammaproteobacteria bacterium]|jgi:two-component system sensor histidine kinase BarA
MTNKKDVVNWNLAVERAGGKKELAKNLFELLIKTLPEHQKKLKAAFQTEDFATLHAEAHKLHSATCYCGTPRLNDAAKKLEDLSKTKKINEIKKAHDKLCDEIAAVLKASDKFLRK